MAWLPEVWFLEIYQPHSENTHSKSRLPPSRPPLVFELPAAKTSTTNCGVHDRPRAARTTSTPRLHRARPDLARLTTASGGRAGMGRR